MFFSKFVTSASSKATSRLNSVLLNTSPEDSDVLWAISQPEYVSELERDETHAIRFFGRNRRVVFEAATSFTGPPVATSSSASRDDASDSDEGESEQAQQQQQETPERVEPRGHVRSISDLSSERAGNAVDIPSESPRSSVQVRVPSWLGQLRKASVSATQLLLGRPLGSHRKLEPMSTSTRSAWGNLWRSSAAFKNASDFISGGEAMHVANSLGQCVSNLCVDAIASSSIVVTQATQGNYAVRSSDDDDEIGGSPTSMIVALWTLNIVEAVLMLTTDVHIVCQSRSSAVVDGESTPLVDGKLSLKCFSLLIDAMLNALEDSLAACVRCGDGSSTLPSHPQKPAPPVPPLNLGTKLHPSPSESAFLRIDAFMILLRECVDILQCIACRHAIVSRELGISLQSRIEETITHVSGTEPDDTIHVRLFCEGMLLRQILSSEFVQRFPPKSVGGESIAAFVTSLLKIPNNDYNQLSVESASETQQWLAKALFGVPSRSRQTAEEDNLLLVWETMETCSGGGCGIRMLLEVAGLATSFASLDAHNVSSRYGTLPSFSGDRSDPPPPPPAAAEVSTSLTPANRESAPTVDDEVLLPVESASTAQEASPVAIARCHHHAILFLGDLFIYTWRCACTPSSLMRGGGMASVVRESNFLLQHRLQRVRYELRSIESAQFLRLRRALAMVTPASAAIAGSRSPPPLGVLWMPCVLTTENILRELENVDTLWRASCSNTKSDLSCSSWTSSTINELLLLRVEMAGFALRWCLIESLLSQPVTEERAADDESVQDTLVLLPSLLLGQSTAAPASSPSLSSWLRLQPSLKEKLGSLGVAVAALSEWCLDLSCAIGGDARRPSPPIPSTTSSSSSSSSSSELFEGASQIASLSPATSVIGSWRWEQWQRCSSTCEKASELLKLQSSLDAVRCTLLGIHNDSEHGSGQVLQNQWLELVLMSARYALGDRESMPLPTAGGVTAATGAVVMPTVMPALSLSFNSAPAAGNIDLFTSFPETDKTQQPCLLFDMELPSDDQATSTGAVHRRVRSEPCVVSPTVESFGGALDLFALAPVVVLEGHPK